MNAPHKFFWLDLVRGLSAIAVCASHLRAALFVDYSSLQHASLLQKLFYLATGMGHQAVMVFFVLSGFFVGGSVLRSAARFSPTSYAVARLSRLWVVLVPALLVTFMIDQVLVIVAPEVLAGAYNAIWNSGPTSAAAYSFGTNGPLWSLANEFWYYVLFPLFAMAIGWVGSQATLSPAKRMVLGVLAAAILWLLPRDISDAFPIWLMGLIVYWLVGRLSPTTRQVTLVIGMLAFGAALAYSKSPSLQAQWRYLPADLAIGAGFCLVCIALANAPPSRNPASWLARLSHGLSAFSYSLYLVHFPIVALIGAYVYHGDRMVPSAISMLHLVGWLALLLAIGAAFWWLFERRTDEIRHFVSRFLKIRPRARAL